MKNVSLLSQLSKEIFNGTKLFTQFLSRPHQFNLREIVNGLLLSGSTYLNAIGKANGAHANERKTIKRLSDTLGKIPTETFAAVHVQNQAKQYRNEPVLILSDGGDLQKPYSKKMEKVCTTVDGSNNHTTGKGYPLHALVAFGLNSETLSVLALRVYSTLDENYNSDLDEQIKNFNLLPPLINSSNFDRIIVEDRGCDDEKRFLYFTKELGCSFVTRIKAGTKSRKFMVKNKNGEFKGMQVSEIAKELRAKAGSEKVWWNKKVGMELASKIAFQKVYLPEHLDTQLYMILCYTEGHGKKFEEPLVILTDLKTDSFEKAWKHFFYYKKRWEVENLYRAIKQQFGAEEFLVMDFEKIKALMFLVMLAYSILLKIKKKVISFFGLMYVYFKKFCGRKQRAGTHQLDILAFLREYLVQSEDDNHYRFYAQRFRKCLLPSTKNQLRLFDLRKIW